MDQPPAEGVIHLCLSGDLQFETTKGRVGRCDWSGMQKVDARNFCLPASNGVFSSTHHTTFATIERVVRARAVRIMSRHRHATQRGISKHDLDELTQEAFAVLWANDARVLRCWDPSRGMSLANFVGLVTERALKKVVYRRQRSCREVLTNDEELELCAGSKPSPEANLEEQEHVAQVLSLLQRRLSPTAVRVLEMLVDNCTMDTICAETGLSRDAIYAWRSRLPRIARRLLRSLAE